MCHNCEKKSKAVDLNSLNHIQLRSFSESSNAIKMFWLRRTKHRYPTPGELTRPSARNTFTLGSTFYHTVFLSQQVTAGHSRSALDTSLLLLPAMPPKSSYYSLFLGGIPAAAAHSDVRDWIWSRTGLEVQQIQIQRRTADATMGAAFLRFERHTVAAACLEALRGQLMWHHCTSISWSRDSAPLANGGCCHSAGYPNFK